MKSLFQLTEEIQWLETTLEQFEEAAPGQPLDPVLSSQVSHFFDQLVENRDAKLDNYAYYIQQLQAELETAKRIMHEFQYKAQIREKRIAYLKAKLMEHMIAVKQKKIATLQFTFTVCANGGHDPIVIDDHEALPPTVYYVPEPQLDMIALRAAMLKDEVPGAHFGHRGNHLRIK